ncbi:MAG: phytoene/squalene synthase family protein [Candidatus Omnitrophota bacterium]
MHTKYKSIKKGFLQARAITKKHAKTFYFASLFLSKKKQSAAYAVYAICRISDESVDNTRQSGQDTALTRIKENIAAAYASNPLQDDLLKAFRKTVKTYRIPKHYFDELIEGMDMDTRVSRYETFQELYRYCYKVAGVVGLIMLKIFGYQNPQAEAYAVDLGVAMQLTNIIRDIAEDFEKGRIYLPAHDLRQFGVSEKMITQGIVDDKFIALLKYQIERARHYYKTASKGIPLISDRNCRFVTLAMQELYSGILAAVERNNYDVFSQRAQVSTIKKILTASKIALRQEY